MKLLKIITSFIFILILAGCNRIQPVMNIEDTPVAYELQKKEVKQAIIAAAEARKWMIKDVNKDEMTAEIYVRSHHAVIKIPYTAKYYSLIYVNSANLKYNSGNIHRNYNKWINTLNQDIKRELSRIAASK
ncbi:hypothetical protein CSW98_12065 [Vibrio sp. HA2012]|uniref:hypothetical protein n=1 Tax=Vibrio sp. HA2012 TaxID=1971595 RepID=UPI000C2BB012|nr:hypothetical protein [Vibrio sp. HA2012]PJC85788.1 hypothetical protein CSW98_12065 [Vibrio sp. HA2012]